MNVNLLHIAGRTGKKKLERLIYGDHNYGARRAPRLPEGHHAMTMLKLHSNNVVLLE